MSDSKINAGDVEGLIKNDVLNIATSLNVAVKVISRISKPGSVQLKFEFSRSKKNKRSGAAKEPSTSWFAPLQRLFGGQTAKGSNTDLLFTLLIQYRQLKRNEPASDVKLLAEGDTLPKELRKTFHGATWNTSAVAKIRALVIAALNGEA